MEINLLQSEGLTRVFCIKVPHTVLNERYDQCMEELRPQLNLRGFRPGKVPLSHAKRMFGSSVMEDVVKEYKEKANQQALNSNNFRPATQFNNQDECDISEVYAGIADLHYHAVCEILPNFKLPDIANIDLKKNVFKFDDSFLDSYAEAYIAETMSEKTQRGEDEVAQIGDTVEVKISLSAEGSPIEDFPTESRKVVAGKHSGLFDVPNIVVGMKTGETKTVPKKYPENFIVSKLASKDLEITVEIEKVEHFIVQPYNETEAIEFYGEDELPATKKDIINRFKNYLSEIESDELKVAILDRLDVSHDFPLPEGMVVQELQNIMTQLQNEMLTGNLQDEDYLKTTSELESEYRKIAERRVRLGLVLAEIGKIDNIAVSDLEVFEYHAMQQNMTENQAQEMVKIAMDDPRIMAQLKAPVYEGNVVEHIRKIAKTEEVDIEITAVINDKEHKYYSMIEEYLPSSFTKQT